MTNDTANYVERFVASYNNFFTSRQIFAFRPDSINEVAGTEERMRCVVFTAKIAQRFFRIRELPQRKGIAFELDGKKIRQQANQYTSRDRISHVDRVAPGIERGD